MERGIVRGATVVADKGAIYQTPLWLGDYSPVEGDPVMLLVSDGQAVVVGPVSTTNRPDTGTISGTPASGRVAVVVGSTTYQARYIGTAPGSGALAMLVWQGTTPWVMGTAAAIPAPGSSLTNGDPTAPPSSTQGTLYVAAVDSGSWRSIDAWGTPSSRPLSTRAVVQYTYTGSNPYSGAWFYGLQAAQLAGATIASVSIRVPSRLAIGSYNSSLSAHLYLHTSSGKPTGDVSRTAGPSDTTITSASTWAPTWVALPLGWAPTLVAGGGVGIFGASYLGLNGLDADPASGQLAFGWTR